MNKNIGRNDPCPCGSGKKYKKCCIDKEDDPEFSDISHLAEIFKQARKEARFKECIYPDKSLCSEKIIQAHSIQNKKILLKISENGEVYMPCPKPDLTFSLQNIYGRKEASIFTGFCSYHDKTIFQPIEDRNFTKTEEQIFLYVYKAFALEYHRKKEAVHMEQFMFSKKPSIANMPNRTINGQTGFNMAVNDLKEEKNFFDNALLSKKYDILTSIVWEFEGFSNFAATGMEAPMTDFDGKKIQDLLDPDVSAKHIYLIVFPENDKTFAIIAWLKKYDELFSTIKERLSSLTQSERKNYINNTIPIITENIAIRPSSWDKLSKKAKDNFSLLFSGIADTMTLTGRRVDRFIAPSYDLFSM